MRTKRVPLVTLLGAIAMAFGCGGAPHEQDKSDKTQSAGDSTQNSSEGTGDHGTGTDGTGSTGSGVQTQNATGDGTGTDTNGATDSGPMDARRAALTEVTSGGDVRGWAVNKDDLDRSVVVTIYLDQPQDRGGTLAITTTASRNGADGNHPGGHSFLATLGSTFCTGGWRDAYIYGDNVLLSADPEKVRCFWYTDAGRAFFDANVLAKLNGCKASGCHQDISYDRYFPSFLGHGPNEGGTARDNSLINRPALANGYTHSGGNRCGGLDGSPCAEFQQWWAVEFAGAE